MPRYLSSRTRAHTRSFGPPTPHLSPTNALQLVRHVNWQLFYSLQPPELENAGVFDAVANKISSRIRSIQASEASKPTFAMEGAAPVATLSPGPEAVLDDPAASSARQPSLAPDADSSTGESPAPRADAGFQSLVASDSICSNTIATAGAPANGGTVSRRPHQQLPPHRPPEEMRCWLEAELEWLLSMQNRGIMTQDERATAAHQVFQLYCLSQQQHLIGPAVTPLAPALSVLSRPASTAWMGSPAGLGGQAPTPVASNRQARVGSRACTVL